MDQNGVRSTYGTGSLRDDHTEDFRSDSYRWDFVNLSTEFTSMEATVYLAWSNPSDDEYGWTLAGGEHHDGSTVNAYHLGVDNNSGATRLRGEEEHPDYFEIMDGDKAVALSSKFVGNRGIKRNVADGVLLEIWYDDGDNESKPSNNWKRALTYVEKEQNWRNPPSDYMVLFRMDEGSLSGIKTNGGIFGQSRTVIRLLHSQPAVDPGALAGPAARVARAGHGWRSRRRWRLRSMLMSIDRRLLRRLNRRRRRKQYRKRDGNEHGRIDNCARPRDRTRLSDRQQDNTT